jgi:hypothetical protein
MIGGMSMGYLREQGVLVDIIIIIHQDTQREEHMHVQGWREAQLCPVSNIRVGYMGQIFCKEISKSSSHHILMESIGREMSKPSCWEWEINYFQLHDYSSNVEVIIATYHLQ